MWIEFTRDGGTKDLINDKFIERVFIDREGSGKYFTVRIVVSHSFDRQISFPTLEEAKKEYGRIKKILSYESSIQGVK